MLLKRGDFIDRLLSLNLSYCVRKCKPGPTIRRSYPIYNVRSIPTVKTLPSPSFPPFREIFLRNSPLLEQLSIIRISFRLRVFRAASHLVIYPRVTVMRVFITGEKREKEITVHYLYIFARERIRDIMI